MGWREYKDHQNAMILQTGQDQVFDVAQWDKVIHCLVDEIRQLDPHGDCWDWVIVNLADKWRELMRTMKEIDTAYACQDNEALQQAVTRARMLYRDCVASWNNRK